MTVRPVFLRHCDRCLGRKPCDCRAARAKGSSTVPAREPRKPR